ncbi:MAG: hypothetical protein RM049_22720 [Nostoc sp. DedQUE04]|uniref:hypothetical protein n=1 Tax=Nostoc sp. DedQUE04 TaxID=3075390 RepID=UPI002AD2F876|nr:hypothetical protein [Nostoc sp. DedQUE04]MDZ8138084.1 hypothetical protein [Nostoc sp. DedQUE04]
MQPSLFAAIACSILSSLPKGAIAFLVLWKTENETSSSLLSVSLTPKANTAKRAIANLTGSYT